MQWFELSTAVIVTIAVLWIPGGVIGRAANLRGLTLWAFAPAGTITVVVVASTLAPIVGIGWSVWTLALVTVLAAAASWGLSRAQPLTTPRIVDARTSPNRWTLPVALAIAAVIIAARTAQLIGDPHAFSQTFDNIFHMNAVRFILDTGNASSLHIGLLTSPPGGQPFYPAAWHGLVALVLDLTGSTIPEAINATSFVIACAVWPAGAVFLTRVLFGGNSVLLVAAGVVSGALPQYPYLPMTYGVLYPYQLGLALVPFALGLLVVVCRSRESRGGRLRAGLALLFVIPGIAVAHPGAFVAWLALGTPFVVISILVIVRRSRSIRQRVIAGGSLVIFTVMAGLAIFLLRPPASARTWVAESSLSQAAADVATLSAGGFMPAIGVALLVAIAVLALLTGSSRRGREALAVAAVASFLYIVVAALSSSTIRDVVTGSWYNNIPRLAALLPMVAVPLAAFGMLLLLRAVRMRTRASPRAFPVVACVAFAALFGVTQTGAIQHAVVTGHEETYRMSAASRLVDTDELQLLDRLGATIPPGDVVAGNPWTGTALAYALAQREVLISHTLAYVSSETQLILGNAGSATAADKVCRVMERDRIRWILDFGRREVHGGYHSYPGFEGLERSASVELRDQQGHARLYEITGCRS
ncbi:hypothetical protein QE367_001352 [Microbacterium paludicola]|uniref:Glycosyltransferase RgtA/B/C/D-like domain-containing protein n=1 Tax=Microbacterium paludicola TaxID=300019 RepID=A0ABU1I1W4_9MICO|nr:DUF6541 family protein [Microbacterium paludicola]MDR6167148.1 hypothetical protein [Microbacterium paludicola]